MPDATAKMRDLLSRNLARQVVGRKRETKVFLEALEGSGVVLIDIYGPGGVGKTTLARHWAAECEQRDIGTVWIDGREIDPIPALVSEAITAVPAEKPTALFFD